MLNSSGQVPYPHSVHDSSRQSLGGWPAVLDSRVEFHPSFSEVALHPIDLASEMAAARQRRDDKTARLVREFRVQTIRMSLPRDSSRAVVEECARGVYPHLPEHLLDEAIALAYDSLRNPPVD